MRLSFILPGIICSELWKARNKYGFEGVHMKAHMVNSQVILQVSHIYKSFPPALKADVQVYIIQHPRTEPINYGTYQSILVTTSYKNGETEF